MMQGHVLLIDDEPALVSVLQPVLKAAGCVVTVASGGHDGLNALVTHNPDVVLLDLGLPDMDGKAVIKAIREVSQIPIIVISARHQEAEKIASLDEGADDST